MINPDHMHISFPQQHSDPNTFSGNDGGEDPNGNMEFPLHQGEEIDPSLNPSIYASSRGLAIRGVPCRFWDPTHASQSGWVGPLGASVAIFGSEGGSGNVRFTGPPQVFSIDEHPMVYHSAFSMGEQCHLCNIKIQEEGYRCDTCHTNLCSTCSSKDLLHFQIPPIFFHREYHPCELQFSGPKHFLHATCARCLKEMMVGYHCVEHKYSLCLFCWNNFVTKANAEVPDPNILSRHVAVRLPHTPRSNEIYNIPKSPRSMDPEQPKVETIPEDSFEPPKRPTAPAPMLLPAILTDKNNEQHSIERTVPSRKAPLPRLAKSSNSDEQMFLINILSASNVRVADTSGLSDPYCCVSVFNGNQPVKELRGCSRTETCFYTLDPYWNCNFLYQPVDLTTTPLRIRLEVYDYDRGWDDDFLGMHTFVLSDPALLGKSQTFPLIRNRKHEGTITYTCSMTNGLMEDDVDPAILEWRHIVEYLGYYPLVPTYYQRLKYVIFVPNIESRTNTFYSVQNTSILEHSYVRGIKSVIIKENGKEYEINFETGKQTCKSAIEPTKKFLCAKRLEKWFFKDDGDVWKPFDDVALTKIWQSFIYRIPSLPLTVGKNQYLIDLAKKEQRNLKTNSVRELTTESVLESMMAWLPIVPLETTNDEDLEILNLPVDGEEFQRVSKMFYITMPSNMKGRKTNTIVGVQKIVNPTLRKNWSHELEMCHDRNKRAPLQQYVHLLWHGTSNTNPKIIYESDKGWKVNYAGDGNLWGRGLYFSQDAVYSAGKYAYMTEKGTQILLLAEVIVGDCIYLHETKETKKMKDAPRKPDGKIYDCVIGNRHNTWIYVTYDSSRAYPTYMVEYHPEK